MVAQLVDGSDVLADPADETLVRAFQDGNLDAATQLYERYARRLYALAKARTPAPLSTRLDADDIVQSVFRSFFRAARAGLYDLPANTQLWPLLLVIALNKIRAQGAFHTAAKRDVRRTQAMISDGALGEAIDRLQTDSSQPFLSAVALDLVDRLPAHVGDVVRLRLDGYSVDEIAGRLQRTKRSVERLLQECRQRLADLLAEDDTNGDGSP